MSQPTDHDDSASIEPPPTEDEARQAEALRAALEPRAAAWSRSAADDTGALVGVALRARAAVGGAPPLDAKVRAAAVDAALRAGQASSGAGARRSAAPWLAAAAALLVAASGAALAVRIVGAPAHPRTQVLPRDAYARPTDALFGAGLAEAEPASARLDTIVRSRTRGYFAGVAAELAAERAGAER
jgi:hypothetical protein